ncbi:MAG: hypothetical protein HKN23_14980 [Verrucomicrobiales bacterium]|nr:hypothetical protein [Verrucomicrobiales bacterium]
MKRLFFFLITPIAIVSAQDSAAPPPPGETFDEKDPRGMLPTSPQSLFPVLPGKMESWELKRSTGETRYNQWLESRVVRIFEKEITLPPIEGAKGGSEKKVTLRTRVTVTDTAKFPSAISYFRNFAPGKEDDYEKAFLEGYPAFISRYGEKELDIQLLVKGRFLVEYALENQPEKFAKEWIQRTKFAKLNSIADSGVVDLPEIIGVVKIDQLNPEKNKAYHLATTSVAQLSRDLKEDEILEKKLLGEIPSIPGELDFPGDLGLDPIETEDEEVE